MQQHVYSIAHTCKLLGIKHIVVSPGSRSAPLVFAFAAQKSFTIHAVIDERSAAYQALGMAQQTKRPVVLVCTSGTAAANYLPAVTEAFYQQIPLIVLTADRPQELLNQQDGQMINQVNLFGSHVNGFYQLPSYTHINPNFKETTRITAEAIANALGKRVGPVHINVPLTEPLYDEIMPPKQQQKLEKQTELWLKKHIYKVKPADKSELLTELENAWINCKKRLILIGQGAMNEAWITPLYKLQQKGEVVILGDVTSNKNEYTTITNFDKLISSATSSELKTFEPDLLVSVGGAVLSKALKNWLRNQKPTWHFRVQQTEPIVNTYGNITHQLKMPTNLVFDTLAEIDLHEQNLATDYVNYWKNCSNKLKQKTQLFLAKPIWSELHATAKIMEALPIGSNLQLANSSVVRYVSWLGNNFNGLIINSNRGTSGIDGCTSTAVGAALVNLRPTVLLTGDLAFLYDKNALWRDKLPANLRIVVFNNNGGGIFTLIDGPNKHKMFQHYFTTPQPKQTIKDVARLFDLDYYFCDSNKNINKTLEAFFNPLNPSSVLEVRFDMKKNAEVFKQFKNIKL